MRTDVPRKLSFRTSPDLPLRKSFPPSFSSLQSPLLFSMEIRKLRKKREVRLSAPCPEDIQTLSHAYSYFLRTPLPYKIGLGLRRQSLVSDHLSPEKFSDRPTHLILPSVPSCNSRPIYPLTKEVRQRGPSATDGNPFVLCLYFPFFPGVRRNSILPLFVLAVAPRSAFYPSSC